MIIYDLDWAQDAADYSRFQDAAKEYGVKVKSFPLRPDREYFTFSADGPKEALRSFLALEYYNKHSVEPLAPEKIGEAFEDVSHLFEELDNAQS